MMRSIFRLLFVGVLLFAFSGMVSAAEDVTGFKGFRWGTEFDVIHREKKLTWYQNIGEIGEHLSLLDAVTDEHGEVAIGFSYYFYQNKLVMGEMTFAKKTDFLDAVRVFSEKYGNPKFRKGSVVGYLFKSTVIFCDSEGDSIQFWSQAYMEERDQREKAEEKAKKDKEFDKIFN